MHALPSGQRATTRPSPPTEPYPGPVPLRRALLGCVLAGALVLAGCRGERLSGLHGIPLEDERIGRDQAPTDAAGQLRLAVRHTQSAQEFADDLRQVIAIA